MKTVGIRMSGMIIMTTGLAVMTVSARDWVAAAGTTNDWMPL